MVYLAFQSSLYRPRSATHADRLKAEHHTFSRMARDRWLWRWVGRRKGRCGARLARTEQEKAQLRLPTGSPLGFPGPSRQRYGKARDSGVVCGLRPLDLSSFP